jgi:hypothetical protein
MTIESQTTSVRISGVVNPDATMADMLAWCERFAGGEVDLRPENSGSHIVATFQNRGTALRFYRFYSQPRD